MTLVTGTDLVGQDRLSEIEQRDVRVKTVTLLDSAEGRGGE